MDRPLAFDPNAKYQQECGSEPMQNDTFMCSILNVVIDHSMEDVTPMEPEEWIYLQKQDTKETRHRLKVPVLRVFGPVLRNPLIPPLQSACLYIHGAFPYMLARPVVAGPDGSLLRASPDSTSGVDWDDPSDVERIQDEIKVILENTLQSLELGSAEKKREDNSNNRKTLSKPNHPMIRKVSVVEGRGFYSFCPGPAAPFLRVEYYDPKFRWKVKLVLEKGLEVPQRYHPDPRQYDRIPSSSDDSLIVEESMVDDVLKFHCYEAHIPYTMQFFKDHNLAGMSYIHLRNGRIRGILPTRFSLNTKQHHVPLNMNDEHGCQELVHRSVFIQSNTPKVWLWPAASALTPPSLHQPSQGSMNSTTISSDESRPRDPKKLLGEILGGLCSDSNYNPPAKGTTCDMEIDCSIHEIQNVESVLTSLPSEQVERDKIQWRAVPSLQEIWREERSRMNKLLSPQLTQEVIQDILSQKDAQSAVQKSVAPPFTLNVKENASRSGARLAVRGMWSLVDVTAGLRQDFVRSLSNILERHRDAINKVDQQLLEQRHPLNAGSNHQRGTIASKNGVNPRRFEFSLSSPGLQDSSPDPSKCYTGPTMIEAVEALESSVATARARARGEAGSV